MPMSAMARLMTLAFTIKEVNINEKNWLLQTLARLTVVNRLALIGAHVKAHFFAEFGYGESSGVSSADTNASTVGITFFT